MNPSQYLAITIAVAFVAYKFWPTLWSGAAKLWASVPSLTAKTTTSDPATITVEQALAAELLLKRFQAQGSSDAGAALALAGIKHLAETTP